MKLKDKLIVRHKDTFVKEMIYLASTGSQHLFADIKNIVGVGDTAVIWCGDVGATEFLPIKKKHTFIQIDETTWGLDIEFIEDTDL